MRTQKQQTNTEHQQQQTKEEKVSIETVLKIDPTWQRFEFKRCVIYGTVDERGVLISHRCVWNSHKDYVAWRRSSDRGNYDDF
jgi:hypothetical protein